MEHYMQRNIPVIFPTQLEYAMALPAIIILPMLGWWCYSNIEPPPSPLTFVQLALLTALILNACISVWFVNRLVIGENVIAIVSENDTTIHAAKSVFPLPVSGSYVHLNTARDRCTIHQQGVAHLPEGLKLRIQRDISAAICFKYTYRDQEGFCSFYELHTLKKLARH